MNELEVEVMSDGYLQFSFALARKGLGKYIHLNKHNELKDPGICLNEMIMEEVKRVLEAKGVLTKEEYSAIESVDIDMMYVNLYDPYSRTQAYPN